jgi:endonuclease YncB( thermonuclease family)
MARSVAARRLLQLRRGAVKGAPSPPYIWIAIAVVVFLALFQWYQQRREDQRAAEEEQRKAKPVAKKDLPSDKSTAKHGKQEPVQDEDPPAKPKRPVVLEPSATDKTPSSKSTASKNTGNKSTSLAKKSAPLPDDSEPAEKHAENPNAGMYLVMHIADGDTFNLKGSHRVRLIGIDCPEIAHTDKDPPTKAQPWSNEAMAFTKARIDGQTVRVEFDPEYDAEDHYGRWLCWVYYRDQRDGAEKLLNEELLRAGLAFAYDDRRKFHYTEAMYQRLKAAQREAQDEQRGIYSK